MADTKKILISVVIPVYNNYFALCELIASISASTFSQWNNIEVVCVDDASTQPKPQLLQDTLSSLPCRHTWVNLKKNSGPATARNKGVAISQGDFVIFFDADVVLYPTTLKNAYNFFAQKRGHAFTGIWDKTQETTAFFPQFKALRDHAYWFIEAEQNARYYLFSTRVAGIEKKLFQKIGGFNTSYKQATVEDIELTYKIEQFTKISFEPEIVVHHEFEGFWKIAKKYFARSRDWIQLYVKRLRFDPVATSKHEAEKSISAGILIVAIAVWIFFSDITILTTVIAAFTFFVYLDYRFLVFLYKEKGIVFMFRGIMVSIALYSIINSGSLVGLADYLFRNASISNRHR